MATRKQAFKKLSKKGKRGAFAAMAKKGTLKKKNKAGKRTGAAVKKTGAARKKVATPVKRKLTTNAKIKKIEQEQRVIENQLRKERAIGKAHRLDGKGIDLKARAKIKKLNDKHIANINKLGDLEGKKLKELKAKQGGKLTEKQINDFIFNF